MSQLLHEPGASEHRLFLGARAVFHANAPKTKRQRQYEESRPDDDLRSKIT